MDPAFHNAENLRDTLGATRARAYCKPVVHLRLPKFRLLLDVVFR